MRFRRSRWSSWCGRRPTRIMRSRRSTARRSCACATACCRWSTSATCCTCKSRRWRRRRLSRTAQGWKIDPTPSSWSPRSAPTPSASSSIACLRHRGNRGQAGRADPARYRAVLREHDSGRRLRRDDPGSQRDRRPDRRESRSQKVPRTSWTITRPAVRKTRRRLSGVPGGWPRAQGGALLSGCPARGSRSGEDRVLQRSERRPVPWAAHASGRHRRRARSSPARAGSRFWCFPTTGARWAWWWTRSSTSSRSTSPWS